LAALPLHLAGGIPTLSSSIPIGPFQLSRVDRPVHDHGPPEVPSLHQISKGTTWVTAVAATHTGYNWQEVQRHAFRDLDQLCGLLSVAFDACVVVRDAPRPRELSAPSVPEKPLPWQCALDLTESGECPPVPVNTAEIPPWLASAWQSTNSHQWLANALAMHHQGLQIEFDHPTMALVAYVSAVEALGNRLPKPDRCPTCRSDIKVRERFETALRQALSDDHAARLTAIYPNHSKTVHQGRLHANEAVPGVLGPTLVNPGQNFVTPARTS
jgi:hypothetical protein